MAPGIKRRPTDDLAGEQRLAKRFDLLNLENDGKRYIPTHPSTNSTQPHGSQHPPRNNNNEYMQVEDTKDKVYIYDLDKELAEVESDEDRPIFIPDIEKHVMSLPASVLIGDDMRAAAEKQMVLYRVPNSLSIPEDKDSVRKAIIETRRRAQENMPFKVPEAPVTTTPSHQHGHAGTTTPYINGFQSISASNSAIEDDPDAMDIG